MPEKAPTFSLLTWSSELCYFYTLINAQLKRDEEGILNDGDLRQSHGQNLTQQRPGQSYWFYRVVNLIKGVHPEGVAPQKPA